MPSEGQSRSASVGVFGFVDKAAASELQPLAGGSPPSTSRSLSGSSEDGLHGGAGKRAGLAEGLFRSGWVQFGITVVVLATALLAILNSRSSRKPPPFTVPGDEALAPTDQPLGMSCPTHGIVHFIHRLAGPWGLPIAMDGRYKPPHQRNLFSAHNQVSRDAVKRVVIYYDLNYPMNTFCKARAALDEHGGQDVHLLTVGFPTVTHPRGLGRTQSPRRQCAPRWTRDFMWLANNNASETASWACEHSKVEPTPCELLMGLVGRLRPPEFPNIKDVRVIGFSAGGQLLDKCMYSQSRFGAADQQPGGPFVRFFIVSPSTLFYPVTERAILPTLPELNCDYFSPEETLKRSYKFRRPQEHFKDIANMTQEPGWYCNNPRLPGHSVHEQRRMCEAKNGPHKKFVYLFSQGNMSMAPGCHHEGHPCWCCRQMKDKEFQQRHACKNFDHYRYGLHGRTPPDLPQGSPCNEGDCAPETKERLRNAILNRNAVYIGGSADVCNWRLQSRSQFQPACGWCSASRTEVIDGKRSEVDFARDRLSPVVDSCRAMWEGFTRLERMKVFKDVLESVVAPRLGVSPLQLAAARQFWTLIGAGHSDNTVIHRLAPCIVRDECYDVTRLVPMDHFDRDFEANSTNITVGRQSGFPLMTTAAPELHV